VCASTQGLCFWRRQGACRKKEKKKKKNRQESKMKSDVAGKQCSPISPRLMSFIYVVVTVSDFEFLVGIWPADIPLSCG
jgi:hypothetical protein